MAKTTLPTDFQDDIMDSSMNGKRRYNLVQNTDGTYSLEDVTTYTQVGSSFGQAQINATNKAVNESVDKANVVDSLVDIGSITTTGKVAGAYALKELFDDYYDTTEEVASLIILGSKKNSRIVTTEQTLSFSSGTATYTATTIANTYGATIYNVIAQLKTTGSTVVTSASVSNNVITVKAYNIGSSTSYTGSLACTIIMFMSIL